MPKKHNQRSSTVSAKSEIGERESSMDEFFKLSRLAKNFLEEVYLDAYEAVRFNSKIGVDVKRDIHRFELCFDGFSERILLLQLPHSITEFEVVDSDRPVMGETAHAAAATLIHGIWASVSSDPKLHSMDVWDVTIGLDTIELKRLLIQLDQERIAMIGYSAAADRQKIVESHLGDESKATVSQPNAKEDRDEILLQWYEDKEEKTFHSPTNCLKKWNELFPARALGENAKDKGLSTVKKGISSARLIRKNDKK